MIAAKAIKEAFPDRKDFFVPARTVQTRPDGTALPVPEWYCQALIPIDEIS
jgi:hypothetical protein